MKRYDFALQAVLRARRAQEAVARGDLLRANLATATAEVAENKSLDHYQDVVSANGLDFMVHRQRSELAAEALIGASGAVRDAQAAVASAMEVYFVAARSVSVLEKLDERQRQEHAAAAQREETKQVDELVTSRRSRHRKPARAQAQARL